MIRILTDSGSDITHVEAKALGIELVELGVTFDDFDYDLHKDLDFSEFYGNLPKAKNLPRTSQVNPSQFLEIFNDVKQKGDEMFVISLSGGLSGTFQSAQIAKDECGYDGIVLMDSQQATVVYRMLVDQAIRLRNEGKNLAEIEAEMKKLGERVGFVFCADTLEYLKKGGRIPPALALIGGALRLKPVITVEEGKAKTIEKARGLKAAIRVMHNYIQTHGFDPDMQVYFGYTGDEARGKEFMEETAAMFAMNNCKLYPVGPVIGTHVGPGCVAVSFFKR